jgi:hypothetical protein
LVLPEEPLAVGVLDARVAAWVRHVMQQALTGAWVAQATLRPTGPCPAAWWSVRRAGNWGSVATARGVAVFGPMLTAVIEARIGFAALQGSGSAAAPSRRGATWWSIAAARVSEPCGGGGSALRG